MSFTTSRAIWVISSRSTTDTPWMSRNNWPRPSPAITILLVVHSVSQPSRVLMALLSAIPSSTSLVRKASRIASEIWSETLSGWPSETDSLVKRYESRINNPFFPPDLGGPFPVCLEMSVATPRDDVGFVVKPEPVMLAQNLPGGIESSAALGHFRQPVVFNLGDIHRRVPCRKSRRGADGPRDLVGQRFHIIPKDRTVIGMGIKIEVPPGGSQLVFHRAQ